ncbi:ubiquitin-conjugating enzyme E2 S, partial [Coemansia nantahalensis]
GISVQVGEGAVSEINATIEGPQDTPYEGGRFQVRLTIDDSFPDTPPRGVFVTRIFHPNVSEKGEICVNTLKRDWQKHYGIEHVLVTVKCLLIYPNPESALNEEAGKLLLERYDDYARHARLITSIHARPKAAAAPAAAPAASSDKPAAANAENNDPAAKKPVADKRKNLRRL